MQRLEWPARSSVSPQREQASPSSAGIPAQQRSQIGMEESCGRGEPQSEQEAGRRAQPTASTGLRSTRTTARHLVVSDGGTSNVMEPESLRKTHLNSASVNGTALCGKYNSTPARDPSQPDELPLLHLCRLSHAVAGCVSRSFMQNQFSFRRALSRHAICDLLSPRFRRGCGCVRLSDENRWHCSLPRDLPRPSPAWPLP